MGRPAAVSKDRKVLRRIDLGAARASLVGQLAAVLVYALVAYSGHLYADFEGMTLALGVLLLVVTAYRLLIAARFDSLHASGPARWRKLFGLGLLAHAAVWGTLLCVVTIHYGVSFNFFAVALYNVGVSTALSSAWMSGLAVRQLYLLIMLVPGIAALMWLREPQALLLAGLLGVFLIFLYRMFGQLHDTFWHALARERRPQRDEEEAPAPQRQSAAVQLGVVHRLAHELRTPLNSMLGMLTLIRETELTDEQQEYQLVADQSGRLLLSLIDDVLDYSRILTGRLVLNPDFFDLRAALEQSLDAYGNIAQDHDVELTGALARDLPRRVRGDRERLMQVLNNLLSNAIKFSTSGEIRLDVSFDMHSERGGTLLCSVSDQGVGMSESTLATLFEDELLGPDADPFAVRKGGFGLLVCKGLVERMNGRIGVESQLGAGSRFWFEVPLDAQPDLGERGDLRRALRDEPVLVVGSASGTAAVLQEELGFFDAHVDAVEGYEDALSRMRDAHREHRDYSLVIIDTYGRRESALNLCRAVQADENLAASRLLLAADIDERANPGLQQLVQQSDMLVVTKPLYRTAIRTTLAAIYGLDTPVVDDFQYQETDEDRARRRRYRLLIVEDNAVNQQVASLFLDHLGYQAKAAPDAESALALLADEHFDLVLMDCVLPGMDGFELTRRIRAWEREQWAQRQAATPVSMPHREQRMPIIALTAATVEGVQARCLAAGMDDFLAKPVRLEELETVLMHWLPSTPSAPSLEVLP